jgi:hypothetical protein
MPEPASYHGDINAGGYKRNRCRMAKSVRGNSFSGEGRNLLGCRRHVFLQLEANAGGSQGISVPVDEDALIFPARLPFQKGLQQFYCFGPERANSFLSTLAEQANLERRFQTKRLGREIQRLLDASTGVEKDR